MDYESEEECGLGEGCSIHFRVNERYFDADGEYGRIITYWGEYAVITDENPWVLAAALRAAYGLAGDDVAQIPRYETSVLYVGAKTIADAKGDVNPTRFVQTHDSWANFENAHTIVLDAVQKDMLDLSQPVSE